MPTAADRSPVCPICATALTPAPTGSDEPVRTVCGLCGTAAVMLANGSVITEVEWKHRQSKSSTATTPDIEPSTPSMTCDARAATAKAAPTTVTASTPRVPRPSARKPAQAAAPTTPVVATTPEPTTTPAPTATPKPTANPEPTAAPEPRTPPTTSALDARAFQGSLANLSVVDVLQLLYSSRKSGLLRLTGSGGTATIALKDGQIIGGGNPTRGRHIGQILVEHGAITQTQLDAALAAQRRAGGARRPLVATLTEQGAFSEEVGWRALAKLIEEILIDVLAWTTGEFIFEVGSITPADGFRHLADGVMAGVGLDTQTTLLEALRTIDEQGPRSDIEADLDLETAFAPMVAPSSPSPAELPAEHTPPPDSEPVTDVPALAPRWIELITTARARFMALPPRSRLALAAGPALLVLLIVVVLLAFNDEQTREPQALSEPTPVTTTLPSAPPPPAAPTSKPALTTPDSVAIVEAEPIPTEEPVSKKAANKRKARKAKTTDARSLFDAAVTPK